MFLAKLLQIQFFKNILLFYQNNRFKMASVGLITLMAAYAFYKWREGPYYTKPYSLKHKVVIITGCNTGIGKEIALNLAQRGSRVYMACRNYEKCEQSRLEIISSTGNPQVFNCSLDLSSLESVRRFVKNFLLEEHHLDILINNAGILGVKRTLTSEGFEQHLAVNHLGHFLLSNLLLEALKNSPSSRIVVISSIIHFIASINKDDLQGECNYNKIQAYAQSKLCNILFTRKLAQLLKGSKVTVNCMHPGVVRTEIWRNDALLRFLNNLLSRLFLRSPKGGAQTALYLAIDPGVEGKSGDYYDRMKVAQIASKAKDSELAEWLWRESAKLVDLNKKIL